MKHISDAAHCLPLRFWIWCLCFVQAGYCWTEYSHSIIPLTLSEWWSWTKLSFWISSVQLMAATCMGWLKYGDPTPQHATLNYRPIWYTVRTVIQEIFFTNITRFTKKFCTQTCSVFCSFLSDLKFLIWETNLTYFFLWPIFTKFSWSTVSQIDGVQHFTLHILGTILKQTKMFWFGMESEMTLNLL